MATIPRVLAYRDWLNLPIVEDGVDEVVNGEQRLMPPARYAHAEILRRLNRLLDRQVDGLFCSAPSLIAEVLSPSETPSRREENCATTRPWVSWKSG